MLEKLDESLKDFLSDNARKKLYSACFILSLILTPAYPLFVELTQNYDWSNLVGSVLLLVMAGISGLARANVKTTGE